MMAPVWELLDSVSADDTRRILSLASERKVDEGEVLFRPGEEARRLFLIRSGSVNLTFPIRIRGIREQILAEARRRGQLVGWSSLVPPHRFTLQAVVAEPAELLVLPGPELRGLLAVEPDMGYRVFSNLARIVGHRLSIIQTMWIRELQRVVEEQGA